MCPSIHRTCCLFANGRFSRISPIFLNPAVCACRFLFFASVEPAACFQTAVLSFPITSTRPPAPGVPQGSLLPCANRLGPHKFFLVLGSSPPFPCPLQFLKTTLPLSPQNGAVFPSPPVFAIVFFSYGSSQNKVSSKVLDPQALLFFFFSTLCIQ